MEVICARKGIVRESTRSGGSTAHARMTHWRHEDAFPRPRLSARCRFSQGTLAGTRGNGRDAPKSAVGCIGEAWRLRVLKLRGGLRFRVVSYWLLPRVQTVRPISLNSVAHCGQRDKTLISIYDMRGGSTAQGRLARFSDT